MGYSVVKHTQFSPHGLPRYRRGHEGGRVRKQLEIRSRIGTPELAEVSLYTEVSGAKGSKG
jgi:hypothetical protein